MADTGQYQLIEEVERLREENRRLKASALSQNDSMEALRESAARLQTILDTTVDGIITINENGIILSFNKAAESIFGYSALDVVGRKVNILMPSPYRENHDSYIANYLDTGNRKIIGIGREVRGRRKDGTEFPLDLAVSEAWVGEKRFFTGILRDISERKKAEEEISKARDVLEERVWERTGELILMNEQFKEEIKERRKAEQELRVYAAQLEITNRDLREFAFIASHDLQEPLRKLRVFADRLKEGYLSCLDDNGQFFLDRMQNAATRMQNLLGALLSYSRITSIVEPFREVDLKSLMDQLISDLNPIIRRTNATIEIDDLPAIEAAPNQMYQLFKNLILNALKFRGDSSPMVRIHAEVAEGENPLAYSRPAAFCRIHVEDNGTGFDERYLDKIFKPFQRLHKRSQYDGTGMGLAICRKIVENHGGSITARSTPGKGTTFLVTLPVTQTPVSTNSMSR